MIDDRCRQRGALMNARTAPWLRPLLTLAVLSSLSLATGLCLASDETPKAANGDRREDISLADAALRALKNNLDISISRHTKESRLTDITVEQAKFDPTLSVNGQYNRTVNPLNRPVFGGTGGSLNQITIF